MSKQFIVCMGGNGSLVLESIIHMCALGAMDVDDLYVLLTELDQGNGNLARVRALHDAYERMQSLLVGTTSNGGKPYEDGKKPGGDFFRTRIHLHVWLPLEEGNEKQTTIAGMLEGQKHFEWLQRALFDQDEAQHRITVGFKGHPNLGMIFMQNILKQHGNDSIITDFIQEFNKSHEQRILFIGSCFGGTGAACLPVLKTFLSERFTTTDITYGMLAILPFFDLPSPKQEETLQINSNCFNDKLTTVLSYYQEHLIKELALDSLYQHIYLLGSQYPVYYPRNRSGQSGQKNPASYLTWFACSAVKQFFHSDAVAPLPPDATPRLHLAWQQDGPMDWQQIDSNVFPQLQQRCAIMLQAAVFYYEKLHRDNLTVGQKSSRMQRLIQLIRGTRGGYPNALLRNLLDNRNGSQQDEFYKALQDFHQYLHLVISWMFDIVTHLPLAPTLQLQGDPDDETLQPYLEFHRMSAQQINDVLTKVRGIHYADNEQQYYPEIQRSITFQRFFNAYILCKLRQGWQGQTDPSRKASTDQDEAEIDILVQLLLHLWDEGAQQISTQSMGVVINVVTMTQYLAPGVTLEDIAADLLSQKIDTTTNERQLARTLLISLLDTLMRWHEFDAQQNGGTTNGTKA